ncbi:MAG: putative manganese-dependent inorganic diphosphatase [Oscillospiraceae bacterium]|nr:putative manganese-dependent inorganic diphosphatase [Oscillospiraceae bacterium]MBQ7341512.1 putative manganese-dependent inorganic diphosphatase [Oscillospiraceae bacterium]
MDPIYVTGHRNPDTDSIVAAMAYAALRNALGDREYEPACLGHVSDETQTVLDLFGFQPPKRITSMHTQIRDLDFDTPPVLSPAVTVGRAWNILQEHKNISALPVAKEDGTLYGMLSRENVASYNMEQVESSTLEAVPLFNVLSVLEGKVLNAAGENTDTVAGEVVIALPQSRDMLFQNEQTIVLCGHQPDMIQKALEKNVNCLVLCQAELSEELRNFPTKTCIISTPFDAHRASRLIFQSAPIGRICKTEELVCFHLEDRVDEVREQVLKFREHCYPILDAQEKVVGVLTRYHLLRPRRKRVVLVDHNEASQSVPGLEEAEILEIIDHHRLADIQTTNPIYVRNEPVGSTNTIIASMFQDKGLMPTAKMAGMMAAAILSDTVMFKSPTCTERDVRTAERMARIANISLEELGKTIFSASMGNRSAEDLLFSDYKEFHIAGHDLAVAQITCVDSPKMLERKEEFLALMEKTRKEKGFSMVILMLTDVLKEGTQLVYLGDTDTIQQAFGLSPKDNTVFLPGIMSRKKQVIPMLSALWG